MSKLTKQEVQDQFIEFLNQDPNGAMSLIGGLWLQVNMEVIRQNGHNSEGRIDIKTGLRNVTIWPEEHDFETDVNQTTDA